MYRITKVLNHNSVIAVDDSAKEHLIMGKGIGFGKKISEQFEPDGTSTVYSLQSTTDRHVNPDCLEISDAILDEAEKNFGRVDRSILFSLADHLQFALQRMKKGEIIKNPLTSDIRVLFHMEYKTALCAVELVKDKENLTLTDDEVGYLALHVHSAIEDEKVSQAMQTARMVRECISTIENRTGLTIEVTSLGYNRLMNHIRYMVVRMESGEKLKLDMNDYMAVKFPETFEIAREVCEGMAKSLNVDYQEAEIGYLAMHIERVGGIEE